MGNIKSTYFSLTPPHIPVWPAVFLLPFSQGSAWVTCRNTRNNNKLATNTCIHTHTHLSVRQNSHHINTSRRESPAEFGRNIETFLDALITKGIIRNNAGLTCYWSGRSFFFLKQATNTSCLATFKLLIIVRYATTTARIQLNNL